MRILLASTAPLPRIAPGRWSPRWPGHRARSSGSSPRSTSRRRCGAAPGSPPSPRRGPPRGRGGGRPHPRPPGGCPAPRWGAGLAVEPELLRGSRRSPSWRTPGSGIPTSSSSLAGGTDPWRPPSWAPSRRRSSITPPCPVLVARGDRATRIILAEDGSPAGIAARDVVAGWPAFAAIPVLVVGVVDVAAPWRSGIAPTMFAAAMDVYTEMLANARTTHREFVAATEAHLRAAGRRADGELREGDPSDQLRRAATDPAGDLIVIGSRGTWGSPGSSWAAWPTRS